MILHSTSLSLALVIATGCGGAAEDVQSSVVITSADTAALLDGQTVHIDLGGPTLYTFDNDDGRLDFDRIELFFPGASSAVVMTTWLDSVGDVLKNDPRNGGKLELDPSMDEQGHEVEQGVGQIKQGLRMSYCTRMRVCYVLNGRRNCVSGSQCYTCRLDGDCTALVPTFSY